MNLSDPDSSGSRTKRKRTTSTELSNDSSRDIPSTGPNVTRSKSRIWYPDGSIVLSAESTIFRVHRSILSQHSQVFKDMLECAQPALDEESIEGCPVVHLPMDSADDVKFLLEAIYDRRIFEIHKPQPLPVIGGILRLARKYDIEYLRKQAVSYITDDYPSTLDDWDDLRLQDTPRINQYPGMPLDLIRLARENDCTRYSSPPLSISTQQASSTASRATSRPSPQRTNGPSCWVWINCARRARRRWSEPVPACTSCHCARRRYSRRTQRRRSSSVAVVSEYRDVPVVY
ncbi:hypothetical protein PLICRDRAFT_512971 [Plicaturopsis crispa FD-325 SS-3]|nr:hypothetical protein PLICRDRAFT_512971 [Plicaturopsis crispa FD-325 SS-3]